MAQLADVTARYKRSTDEELSELATYGREGFAPGAWDALQGEMIQRQLELPEVRLQASVAAYPKAPVVRRLGAAVIDWIIAISAGFPSGYVLASVELEFSQLGIKGMIGFVMVCAPWIWATWYLLAKDGRAGGQSIGKKRLGLMVIHLHSNQPCSMRDSALRVLVLCVPFVSSIESLLVLLTEDGRRLGDRMTHTQVIAVGAYTP